MSKVAVTFACGLYDREQLSPQSHHVHFSPIFRAFLRSPSTTRPTSYHHVPGGRVAKRVAISG